MKSWKKLYKDAVKVQRKHVYERKATTDHTDTIKNASNPNKSDEELYELIKNVFDHHEIDTFSKRADIDSVKTNNKNDISIFFHESYYLNVPVCKGLINSNPTLTQEEIVDRITSNSEYEALNVLHFMVGGVGVGKTTFLCNMLYHNWEGFLSKNKFPVRINMDRMMGHHTFVSESADGQTHVSPSLIKVLADVTINVLESNSILDAKMVSELKMATATTDRSENDIEDSDVLKHLIRLIREKHNLSPVYIIDNMDYLYHLGDRGVFSSKMVKSTKEAFESIVQTVKLFSKNNTGSLKRMGLNVLYVVRPETIEFLQDELLELADSKLINNSFSLNEKHYTVDFATSVVSRRFEMLKDLSKKITEQRKSDDFLRQIERLESLYVKKNDNVNRLFNDLWGISRKGLRDFIDLFGEYSWMDHGDIDREDLNTRFINQYSPSIISYIMGGHLRYSQFNANIPNLFLVNTAAKSHEEYVPKHFKINRLYTAWLKYLILQYLLAKKNQKTNLEEILKVFCGSNNKGYHPDLVRFILGSLAEVPRSEFIDYQLEGGTGGRSVSIKDFSISGRGEYFISNLVHKFTYLQLIVDDHRMLIPKTLSNNFTYEHPNYGYLVKNNVEYTSELRRLLINRGRQTIRYSMYLDEVLSLEKEMYSKVFGRLEEEKVNIPIKNYLTNSVKSDVEFLMRRNGIDFNSIFSKSALEEDLNNIKLAAKELYEPHKNLCDTYYGVTK